MINKSYIKLRDKHMTYTGVGHIMWKGKTFEHYNDPWPYFQELEKTEADVMQEIRKTIDRILHIESLGLIPTTSTVIWDWPRYKDLTKDCKYLNLFQQMGDIYHLNGNVFAVRLTEKDRNVVYIENGKVMKSDFVDYENLYHYFVGELGMKYLNIGQNKNNGLMYANTKQWLAFLEKNNFPIAI